MTVTVSDVVIHHSRPVHNSPPTLHQHTEIIHIRGKLSSRHGNSHLGALRIHQGSMEALRCSPQLQAPPLPPPPPPPPAPAPGLFELRQTTSSSTGSNLIHAASNSPGKPASLLMHASCLRRASFFTSACPGGHPMHMGHSSHSSHSSHSGHSCCGHRCPCVSSGLLLGWFEQAQKASSSPQFSFVHPPNPRQVSLPSQPRVCRVHPCSLPAFTHGSLTLPQHSLSVPGGGV